jgi:hypothetical protein
VRIPHDGVMSTNNEVIKRLWWVGNVRSGDDAVRNTVPTRHMQCGPISGHWTPAEPTYSNNKTFWRQIGVVHSSHRRDGRGFGYKCPNHKMFNFVPGDGCGTLEISPATACSHLLRDASTRQLIFVGDRCADPR